MIYDTIIDYILDNRNDLYKDLIYLSSNAKETVLSVYDWLAGEYIKEHFAYEIFKSDLIERFGEKMINEIEIESSRNFRLLEAATRKYLNDVDKGRKVGYSATENEELENG